ncbi:MAG: hypothetical protein AB1432_11910 [Bacteroidota bacterium]
MKKIFAAITSLLIIGSCSTKDSVSEMLEGKLSVNVYLDKIEIAKILDQKKFTDILILLHNKVKKEKIISHLNLTEDIYNNLINHLFMNGLIKSSDGKQFVPACMVVTSKEEEEFNRYVSPFANDLAEIVIGKHQIVKEKYLQINSFFNISFDELSLFILYNVMLDKWQSENVVQKFLRSDITQRGNNNYYLMIKISDTTLVQEKKIWIENKFTDYNDYYLFGFGRISRRKNFFDITREELISDFRMSESALDSTFKKRIVDDLIKFMGGEINAANPDLTFPLNKYGLLKNNELLLPVISKRDNELILQIAGLITDELINYLDKNRPAFVKQYLSSGYKDEVNFREWLFWLYKFIIAETANILYDKGYIKQPSRELFYYIENK